MRCPKCGCQDDKVIDSRASREGATIRRRRQCVACGFRFTTYEEIERAGLVVLKRDGRREEFSKEKLLSGVRKACQKRPVSLKIIEDLVEITGGRAFFPDSVYELEDICTKIAVELQNQYVLGYHSTNGAKDGKWRKLHVKVEPVSHVSVHARSGYYARME